jgi:hypothetical protein
MIPSDMFLVRTADLLSLLEVALARGESLGYDSDDDYRQWIDEIRASMPPAAAEPATMDALMAVEWSASEAGPEWDECPWCRNYRRDGHRADCQRQLALGLASETLDGAIAKEMQS